MPSKLSRRQQEILEFIQEFMDEHQFPPTVRDIQAGCQISSTSVVDYNLHKLQQNNFLKRLPEVSRGIELIGEGLRGSKRDIISVPIMGNIAAGEPLHVPDAPTSADEGYEQVDLPASMVGGAQDVFALRVKGESMIDALVADGDLVFLEPTDRVNNGDMVAAWLNSKEETTLKRFFIEGDMVRLQPANAAMDPIYVPASDVSVRGKVVGVFRTL
jgi:repressor LexA